MKNIVKFSGYEDGVKNKHTFSHEENSTKMLKKKKKVHYLWPRNFTFEHKSQRKYP